MSSSGDRMKYTLDSWMPAQACCWSCGALHSYRRSSMDTICGQPCSLYGPSIRSRSANARPVTRSLWLASLEARLGTHQVDDNPSHRFGGPLNEWSNDMIMRYNLNNREKWKCDIAFRCYEVVKCKLKCTSTNASSARVWREPSASSSEHLEWLFHVIYVKSSTLRVSQTHHEPSASSARATSAILVSLEFTSFREIPTIEVYVELNTFVSVNSLSICSHEYISACRCIAPSLVGGSVIEYICVALLLVVFRVLDNICILVVLSIRVVRVLCTDTIFVSPGSARIVRYSVVLATGSCFVLDLVLARDSFATVCFTCCEQTHFHNLFQS